MGQLEKEYGIFLMHFTAKIYCETVTLGQLIKCEVGENI